MTQQVPNCKTHIIELLGLLASEEQQLAYEKNVPHVDITTELVCMWFDDQYHPDYAGFISSFTPDELATLAEFHRFYDEREKQLPESQGTVRTWLASPIWREIMEKAHETVTRIAA
jgi:hypothetical protein